MLDYDWQDRAADTPAKRGWVLHSPRRPGLLRRALACILVGVAVVVLAFGVLSVVVVLWLLCP